MDDQVTLEAYTDENRSLFHNGRHVEVIAICKHILHYYPKHIDSYRQLGEAYLEKEQLDPATETFRRVLSADPENLIAYAGLATIFEQQHLIDEAVWHLERAYEIAPDNFEIHKELLRMYSEAGTPRQRLKLTAGGLARLYAQEGLYSQAIQELRAISNVFATRFDVRTALAEILWHAGHLREAAELAQSILASLPYCLKANLILGAVWKEADLPESETYLNRAQELDPTNKVAQRIFGARSPLAVAQVRVPRYVEGAPPPPLPVPASPGSTQLEPGKSPAEEEILAPDLFADTWVEAAPATETAEPTLVLGEQATPPAQEAELPKWLTEPSPAESAQAATEESIEPEAQKPLAGLEGTAETGESTSTREEKVKPVEAAQATEVPDWLRKPQTAPAEETTPAPPESAAPSEKHVVPDFIAQAPAKVTPVAEHPAPDFLTVPSLEKPSAKEPVAEKAPRAMERVTEASGEVVAEMPPAPAIVESTPPIVVEMPSAPSAPAPTQEAPAAEPTAPAPKRKRQPKGYPHLVQAREHRDASRLEDALTEYDYLVQHAPRLVSSVIDDLEELTAREDAPLEAHRILGDAYMRADRLAEALQRYQFVLERTSDS